MTFIRIWPVFRRDIPCTKMNFRRQGFEGYRITDIQTWLKYHAASWVVKSGRNVCFLLVFNASLHDTWWKKGTFTFAICHRPSVSPSSVCLSSVTFVHPTQAIEIFGNVWMPFGTLAIRDKIRPLCRSWSFKVTSFGTNRKLIRDFLLVNSTNLPPILHRFKVMVNYWSDFR